ncbi:MULTISPECIES: class I ribonucleotide reductase maintenance protein YfaE [Neisseria]|uniref:2Fe-2S iron-sulfur cluster binding domain protein n=1 Tax=Neisseria lactamica ATCC 23970 TaxID=546265 RepID=D0W8U4_NEILA|nr:MULTISPECIES: class I ribonucleotide reductase maintenance protein YfaE [Neisseria]EEZ76039.1 2Fe-2S iron-sulfur cluster binding domain protein [Neisseria lactamica ATCC 23970]
MALISTRDRVFELLEGETLLEGLERTGHMVEYQCRSGYCGSCRVKILEGSVTYREPPLAFLGRDEILPCCCCVEGDVRLDCGLTGKEESLPDGFLK